MWSIFVNLSTVSSIRLAAFLTNHNLQTAVIYAKAPHVDLELKVQFTQVIGWAKWGLQLTCNKISNFKTHQPNLINSKNIKYTHLSLKVNLEPHNKYQGKIPISTIIINSTRQSLINMQNIQLTNPPPRSTRATIPISASCSLKGNYKFRKVYIKINRDCFQIIHT